MCTSPDGIQAHVLAAEYLGELYPPYRWFEKQAVVRKTQVLYGLKPTLPDFYNILLERPREDSEGYGIINYVFVDICVNKSIQSINHWCSLSIIGILYVDASQFANLGSSCSHSCDPNCTSSIVVRKGKTTIAMSTVLNIH